MSALMTTVGLIFTESIGWVSTVATTITDKPIILLFVVLPLVGLGIGLFKRLINC